MKLCEKCENCEFLYIFYYKHRKYLSKYSKPFALIQNHLSKFKKLQKSLVESKNSNFRKNLWVGIIE